MSYQDWIAESKPFNYSDRGVSDVDLYNMDLTEPRWRGRVLQDAGDLAQPFIDNERLSDYYIK